MYDDSQEVLPTLTDPAPEHYTTPALTTQQNAEPEPLKLDANRQHRAGLFLILHGRRPSPPVPRSHFRADPV